jgi:hypothetical protein
MLRKSNKPTKKMSLPPLTQKQKNSESQIKRKIAQTQQSQTKKLNARTQKDIFPVATA